MFENTKLELDIEKLDTTPTDFEKFAKSVDVKSLEKISEILQESSKQNRKKCVKGEK